MSEKRPAVVGEAIFYFDPVGKRHDALVTAAWSDTGCNLVYVSSDENQTDNYGRKIERSSSCCHKSVQPAHGNYWTHSDE